MAIVGLSPDDYGAVSTQIKAAYDREKRNRYRRERRWIECEYAWDGTFGRTWKHLEAYRSRRFMSLIYEAAEAVVSELIEGVMPNDDFCMFLGREPGDAVRAEVNRALFKYQAYRSDLKERVEKFARALFVYGTCPFRLTWVDDMTTVPDYRLTLKEIETGVRPADGSLTYRKMSIYSGPVFEMGNIFDFVVVRTSVNRDRPLQILYSVQPASELKEKEQPDASGYAMYVNVGDVQDANISPKRPSDNDQRTADQKRGLQPDIFKWGVGIYEAHGDIPVRTAGGGYTIFENHVATCLEDGTLIRFEPNANPSGMSPWRLANWTPHPRDPIYGLGGVEPVLDLMDVVNIRMNQVIDANEITINPMLKAIRDGVFIPEDFISQPGGLVEYGTNGGVDPLVIPSQAALGFQELQFMMGRIDEITVAQRNLSQGGTPISATESSVLAGKVEKRQARMLRRFENTVIRPMLQDWIKLNSAFITEPQVVRTIGSKMRGVLFTDTGMPILEDGLIRQIRDLGTQVQAQVQQAMQDPTGMMQQQIPMVIQAAQMTISQVLANNQGASVGVFNVDSGDIAADFDIICLGASMNDNNMQMAQKIQLYQIMAQDPEMSATLKRPELATTLWEDAKVNAPYRFIKSPLEVALDQFSDLLAQLGASIGTIQPPPLQDTGGMGTASGAAEAPGMDGPEGVAGGSGDGLPPAGGPAPEQLSARQFP